MSERWKPEYLETYWSVLDTTPVRFVWQGIPLDVARWEAGNVFKTHDQALIASINIKSLLLSLHYNGTSTANSETLKDTFTEYLKKFAEQPVANWNQFPKLTAEVFDRPDCPEWAQYAAVDADGDGYYYEDKPRACEADGEWLVDKCIVGTNRSITGAFDPIDWQNSLIERPVKETKLPDWCKPGEWVYLSNGEYDKIESIDGFGINLASGAIINKKYIHEEAVSARLRPYNADEMQGLVGKLVKDDNGTIALVVGFRARDKKVLFGNLSFTSDDLLRYKYIIDGKPSCVLEHLENGEWVE